MLRHTDFNRAWIQHVIEQLPNGLRIALFRPNADAFVQVPVQLWVYHTNMLDERYRRQKRALIGSAALAFPGIELRDLLKRFVLVKAHKLCRDASVVKFDHHPAGQPWMRPHPALSWWPGPIREAQSTDSSAWLRSASIHYQAYRQSLDSPVSKQGAPTDLGIRCGCAHYPLAR